MINFMRMKRLPAKLILGSLLIIALPALAQKTETIETDRPDQTETPYLTPKRWFQAEAGFTRERSSDGTVGYIHPTLLSKYGLGNRFELRLITSYVTYQTQVIPNGTVYESGLLPEAVGGGRCNCGP